MLIFVLNKFCLFFFTAKKNIIFVRFHFFITKNDKRYVYNDNDTSYSLGLQKPNLVFRSKLFKVFNL